jgi:hypothetical protein
VGAAHPDRQDLHGHPDLRGRQDRRRDPHGQAHLRRAHCRAGQVHVEGRHLAASGCAAHRQAPLTGDVRHREGVELHGRRSIAAGVEWACRNQRSAPS